MSFGIYEASVPVFSHALANMRDWLGKAAQELDEATLIEARLAPDMKPLRGQYQMASDMAKNALARLTGQEPPPMPDTEHVRFPPIADTELGCEKAEWLATDTSLAASSMTSPEIWKRR